jgi:stage V sporulation protein B
MQDVGFGMKEANALYGQLTGMAGPVINIPMSLALSIALSMVPAIAAANSLKDTAFLNMNVRLGLRTAMIIGVPCTFGLMTLAEPIMLLIYPLQAESASSAAPCLFLLAIGIVFLCVAQTMAGILQGLGHPYVAVISLGAGVVVRRFQPIF